MDNEPRYRPRVAVVRALVESRGYAPTARKVGSSAGYLHDICRGRRNGSTRILRAIADEFGLALDDIADPIEREVMA